MIGTFVMTEFIVLLLEIIVMNNNGYESYKMDEQVFVE